MTLGQLNGMPEYDAVVELLKCCGSTAWAHTMAGVRRFDNFNSLCIRSERIWWQLEPADWLEAFRAHARIGERKVPDGWSAQEQSGMNTAAASTSEALARANEQYLARFGYIFIVCATGKSAEEMLSILEGRMRNDPADELSIAATEQSKITRLRLEKLISS
jgi:OHCU decarboxylase